MKNWFSRLDLDSRLTAFGLLLLLVTWAIDFFRAPGLDRLSFLILPLLMLVFFLILISDRLRFESRIEDRLAASAAGQLAKLVEFTERVDALLERRLPKTEFIRGKREVEDELTKAAAEARSFIIATGGKSRIKKYLATITTRVDQGTAAYTRLIFGGHIHHELCSHLCAVVGKARVRVAHAPDEKSGTALITDNALIFTTIPSTEAGTFDTVVKVPDPVAAEEYRENVTDLLIRSKTLNSPEEIMALCTSCSAKLKRPGEAGGASV